MLTRQGLEGSLKDMAGAMVRMMLKAVDDDELNICQAYEMFSGCQDRLIEDVNDATEEDDWE